VTQDECSAELYIDRGKGAEVDNKAIFDQLFAQREDIERAFGGSLIWERLDNKRASRIKFAESGGYRSAEDQWNSIQTAVVNAMNRLEAAMGPSLKQLKIGA